MVHGALFIWIMWLTQPISEFEVQGLELDHTLLIWGTDFMGNAGSWDHSNARKYKSKSGVRDQRQLRRNAYRVLLTRGREGLLVCLPKFLHELDETFDFVVTAGCEPLS